MSNPSDLETLADDNLVESVRAHARWQSPSEVFEADGVLCVAGANPLPIPFRNCAIRVDPGLAPALAVERIRRFFTPRERGFAMLLRDSRDQDLYAWLVANGGKPGPDQPCMLIDRPVALPPLPADVVVARATTPAQIADAVAISAAAYESLKLPPAEARLYFGRVEGLLTDDVEVFVARRGDEPLATAMTLHSGAGAGVYWVGTVAAARGSGLGDYVTRRATNAGFERGARSVALQASPFGEAIYRRMGYREYDRLRRVLCPLPVPD